MKDYKEMTESVLQQAKLRSAQQKHQRRMATGLIAAALCLAILISVVGVGMNRTPVDDTQLTISMEDPAIDLKVVFLNTENGQETPLEFGVTMPIEYFVYVRDLRGSFCVKARRMGFI